MEADSGRETNGAHCGGSIPSEFKVLARVNTPHNIPITKYRSKRAGYEVVVADIDSPIVTGCLTFATEASSDDGCPHTLEHLVFLGSEDYPFKGILDSLASKVNADGTNAFTYIDHTSYEISTAGSEGFLTILPIFADHVLFPLLTDQGFVTEVHHINGQGEDEGVVYSEMQASQNTQEDRMDIVLRRELYPAPCGFRHQTGGLVEEIRSLSVQSVRKFHRSLYTPDNMCIFAAGKIDHAALLSVLVPVSDKIIKKNMPSRGQRPFVDSPPIQEQKKSVDREVLFPDEDETCGSVVVAWQGPGINDRKTRIMGEILLMYLTDSAISPLRAHFVETNPCLATDVGYQSYQYLMVAFGLFFENVPTEMLPEIKPRLLNLLQRIVADRSLDMDRIMKVIDKRQLETLDAGERSPVSLVFAGITTDFLYGRPGERDLFEEFDDIRMLERLRDLTADEWLDQIECHLLKKPNVTLRLRPSAKESSSLSSSEEKRLAEQARAIGPKKLAELDQALQDAKKFNERPIPQGVLDRVSRPTGKINFIATENAVFPSSAGSRGSKLQQWLQKELGNRELPFRTQYNQFESHFVQFRLFVDSRDLSCDERRLLELYVRSFFSLPAFLTSRGRSEPYDVIVKILNEITVRHTATIGQSWDMPFQIGEFGDLLRFSMKFKPERFEEAVMLMGDLFMHSQFNKERLKVVVEKLLKSIPELRRDPDRILDRLMNGALLQKESIVVLLEPCSQEGFLKTVLEDDEALGRVCDGLESLRSKLMNPNRIRMQIFGDISKIKDPVSVLINTFKRKSTTRPAPVRLRREFLTDLGLSPTSVGLESRSQVVASGATESSFTASASRGPYLYSHKDIVPLYVITQYLDQMEGPFWQEIRGAGLAYSFYFRPVPTAGLLYFEVANSTNAAKAFGKARDIVHEFSTGRRKLEKDMLDSARGSLVHKIVNGISTKSEAAYAEWEDVELKGLTSDSRQRRIEEIETVTHQQLLDSLNRYVVPLFSPETSVLMAVAAPSLAGGIRNTLCEDFGFEMGAVTESGGRDHADDCSMESEEGEGLMD